MNGGKASRPRKRPSMKRRPRRTRSVTTKSSPSSRPPVASFKPRKSRLQSLISQSLKVRQSLAPRRLQFPRKQSPIRRHRPIREKFSSIHKHTHTAIPIICCPYLNPICIFLLSHVFVLVIEMIIICFFSEDKSLRSNNVGF